MAIQAWILIACAALFTVGVILVNNQNEFQIWYIGLKLGLLLLLPLVMLRRMSASLQPWRSVIARPPSLSPWRWFGPLFVVCVWLYISYGSPYGLPYVPTGFDPAALALAVLFGFLINSLLEEVFYRVWLQTRLEQLLGRWPAIALTSVLWASWHLAIQSIGQWNVDLATVLSNQGITGLFLGYLWAKYRNVWAIVIIHGVMNAPPQMLMEIFGF
ncbi:CPBP family intramembrane glutamic endopeptidase [Paenibacillus sp. GCM10027629]|uniref:CPBP family intramembrane glutamic endopeptidase n=1 Tax=Paenibacillus sp. GCM10027629 TaxID=3273414 RepID=UPI0036388687